MPCVPGQCQWRWTGGCFCSDLGGAPLPPFVSESPWLSGAWKAPWAVQFLLWSELMCDGLSDGVTHLYQSQTSSWKIKTRQDLLVITSSVNCEENISRRLPNDVISARSYLKNNLDLMTIITRDNLQVTLLLVLTQENQGTKDGIHLTYLQMSSQVLI